MKKTLRLLILMSFAVLQAAAQNPVPNGGFENWTGGNPDNWFTTNIVGFVVNVTQATPPYSGQYAAMGEVVNSPAGAYPPTLASTDAAGNGFPVSQLYGAFNFYYKYNHSGTSYFYGVATISDAGNQGIGAAGSFISSTASSYTLSSAPFFYFGNNPASCVILFSIADSVATTPQPGNYFIVDEVSLTGSVGIGEVNADAFEIEKVSPNPVSGTATVYYALGDASGIRFEVTDMHGRRMGEWHIPDEIPGRHKTDLDMSGIPAGLYLLRMLSEKGAVVSRIAVVH